MTDKNALAQLDVCPHCKTDSANRGGITYLNKDGTKTRAFAIRCLTCHYWFIDFSGEEETVAAWNKRTPAPAGEVATVSVSEEKLDELKDLGLVHCDGGDAGLFVGMRNVRFTVERLASPVQQECPYETNLTGCLHPEEHQGRCGYSQPVQQAGVDQVERAVMVCPQCEGEGSYADGLDEAACTTECTRCGGNGWIVDVAALAAMRPADLHQRIKQAIETMPYLDHMNWDEDVERPITLREFYENTYQGEHAEELFTKVAQVVVDTLSTGP